MPDPAGPQPVRFTESTENAFTLVVSEGWSVDAGVVRVGADARPWYRVRSPRGTAELRAVDPRMPLQFVAPGFGMMPMPGAPVRPYVPAIAFAEEYARGFARESGASSFEPTGARDAEAILADDPRPTSRPRVQMLLQQGADVGGITFGCPDRGLAGLVDVVTLRMPGPFGMIWTPFVTALIGPAEAWTAVRATLLQIVFSYEASPAWQQGQQQMQAVQHQMTMDTIQTGTRISQMQHQSSMEAIHQAGLRSQIAAQASADISAMQQRTWEQQQASSDERHRRAVNGITERVDLVDPATGTLYHGAPAGFRTYWTDGAGRVVGSDGSDNPDPTRFSQATDLDDL